MLYARLADLVVLLHSLFVLFVVAGGVLVWRWPRLARIHLPAAVWGVMIEFGGWICPLTYLENYFRRQGGMAGYRETFVEHYLEPTLYPLGLTAKTQLFFGLTALGVNLACYLLLWQHRRR